MRSKKDTGLKGTDKEFSFMIMPSPSEKRKNKENAS